MKLCWSTIENLYLTKGGYFRDRINGRKYIERDYCVFCGDSFLAQPQSKGLHCSKECEYEYRVALGNKKFIKKIRQRKITTGQNNPFFGKKHTEETREKMRKNHADIRGDKNPFFGKHHSEKTKKTLVEKLRIRNTGIGNPRYGVEGLVGERNPNWRHGKSLEPYCRVWKDDGFREYIYFRDKEKNCWNPQCSHIGYRIMLHHINYDKKDCRPENIIKLCSSCNSLANFDREWWESFYKEIMRRRNL